MPGLLDFLFGSGPLRKLAGGADKRKTPDTPAGLDMAALAQAQAQQQQSQAQQPWSEAGSYNPMPAPGLLDGPPPVYTPLPRVPLRFPVPPIRKQRINL